VHRAAASLCGQRKPALIARRLLDLIRANPANWRAMIEAA